MGRTGEAFAGHAWRLQQGQVAEGAGGARAAACARVRHRAGRPVLAQRSLSAMVAAGAPQPLGHSSSARVVVCGGVWERAAGRLRVVLQAWRCSWAPSSPTQRAPHGGVQHAMRF